jgi:hypothetical protein
MLAISAIFRLRVYSLYTRNGGLRIRADKKYISFKKGSEFIKDQSPKPKCILHPVPRKFFNIGFWVSAESTVSTSSDFSVASDQTVIPWHPYRKCLINLSLSKIQIPREQLIRTIYKTSVSHRTTCRSDTSSAEVSQCQD